MQPVAPSSGALARLPNSVPPLLLILLLAGCGGSGEVSRTADLAAAAAEFAVAHGRCAACHPATGAAAERLQPLPSPSLPALLPARAASSLPGFLARHHAGSAAAAADLAAFLVATWGSATLRPASVDDAQLRTGERLFRELACTACHAPSGIQSLAEDSDRDHVLAFLQESRKTRPDLPAHDYAFTAAEAEALASWLLRAQAQDASLAPWSEGLRCECFELQIDDANRPDLTHLPPKQTATVTVLDVAPRTREDHFALRFRGELQVPAAGDYTFTAGADDCVWLSVDGAEVVANAALAPFRRKSGTAHLEPGWHAFEVLFTEAGGGQELEVTWQGPGLAKGPIASGSLRCRSASLVPPAAVPAPEPAAVARGAQLFTSQRCGSCHDGASPAAAPAPLTPLAQLQKGAVCKQADDAAARNALPTALAAMSRPRSDRGALAFAMQRDGCFKCHARDGNGGLSAAAIAGLVSIEDLGEEGRLPPDLTRVGHRLRPQWLTGVLTGEKRVRTYLHARMPQLEAEAAARYTQWFAAVDAAGEQDVEPPFSAELAQKGAAIAGNTGHTCINCHTFAGHRSQSAQGMDMTLQFERTRPQWFREWLLSPVRYHPGTRMPTFWPNADAAAEAEIAALRVWLSLGKGAPLPVGLTSEGLVLEPNERPILHGAFLRGLSARCIAVGSPLRAHYAYDLAHLRLAWLWRGGFVDANGTWSGRAGQLLEPLSDDRVVLPEGCPFAPADGRAAVPHLLGWRLEPDGYPLFRLQVGDAVVEDCMRPRLLAGGAEMVRSVHAVGAAVRMTLPPPGGKCEALVGGAAVAETVIKDGQTVEVVYRW